MVEILHVTATGRGGAADAAASMKPEDRDEVRRLAALRAFSGRCCCGEGPSADVVVWRDDGGPEAEDFLHALETGGHIPCCRNGKSSRQRLPPIVQCQACWIRIRGVLPY